MKNAGSQHRIRTTELNAVRQVIHVTDTTGGNDRHVHRVRDGPGQCQIKTRFGAVAVHAGEQNLSRTVLGHAACPSDDIQPRVLATAMAVDIPPFTTVQHVVAKTAFGVNGHHNGLGTVFVRYVLDDAGVGDGRRVETGFVSTRIQQPPHILHRAHATAHGQRNEYLRRHRFDDVQNHVAPIAGGGDIEKRQLVRPLVVVTRGNFNRVAGVPKRHKIDAFDHTATRNVQTGNDAFG